MNSFSMWNLRKQRCSSVWEADRRGHEVTNCEKCKDNFPSLGGLKKHLSKVHDIRNLVLEGKSETCYWMWKRNIVWSMWESYKISKPHLLFLLSQGGALEVWWWNGTYNVGLSIIEWFLILSKLSRMWHWPWWTNSCTQSASRSCTEYIEGNPSQNSLLVYAENSLNCKDNSKCEGNISLKYGWWWWKTLVLVS